MKAQTQIATRLTAAELVKLDRLARAADLTRWELVRSWPAEGAQSHTVQLGARA